MWSHLGWAQLDLNTLSPNPEREILMQGDWGRSLVWTLSQLPNHQGVAGVSIEALSLHQRGRSTEWLLQRPGKPLGGQSTCNRDLPVSSIWVNPQKGDKWISPNSISLIFKLEIPRYHSCHTVPVQTLALSTAFQVEWNSPALASGSSWR